MAGPEVMQADIAAALAAGIPAGRIALYSLERLIDRPDAAEWVAVPGPEAAPADDLTGRARTLFRLLDATGD